MTHAIHQFIKFISPIIPKNFLTNQIWGSLPKESCKTALKVASAVALVFVLCCSRRLYRYFTSPPQEPTIPPAVSSATTEEDEETEAFFTPSSETPLSEIGELVSTERGQQQLAEKLQQVHAEQQSLSSSLEKLKQIFLPFSYPCELPRQSGAQEINFIDYFLKPPNIKNCTLDTSGRFTLTFTSKQEFKIRYLPDFAVEDFPVQVQGFLKGLVNTFSPKVQISDLLCGQITQHESSLEIIFNKGAIVIPEIARFPWNYKAEVKSIKFIHPNKEDESSTILLIDVEHNSSAASALGFTGKDIKAYPHLLIKFLDMNLSPRDYGLS